MTDLSEYEILERQVVSKSDWDFSRSLDKAIAEENEAYTATLCPECSGAGVVYIPIGPKGREFSKHRRETCERCGGSGER